MNANGKLSPRERERKPRAMDTAAVERLLRDASDVAAEDLPEPSPDLVARAVGRALASEERRRCRRSPLAGGVSRPFAFGAVAAAGIVAWAVVVTVPFSSRPSRTAANPSTVHFVAQTTPLPAMPSVAEAVSPGLPARPSLVRSAVARTVDHRTPYRLVARRYRRRARQAASPVRLVVRSPFATRTAKPSSLAAPKRTLPLIAQATITAAPAVPAPATFTPTPRPFWHDEQVERDDYIISAPAIIAEGTEQGVTSVRPAVVQVAFSTTHPVAANATYDAEPANP